MSSNVTHYLRLLRTYQWSKNLVIFAGLIFAGKLFVFEELFRVLIVFLLFSLMSSAVYIINDINDLEDDIKHPAKKNRPIASGKVQQKTAWIIAFLLIALSLLSSFFLEKTLTLLLFSYLVLNLLYSKYLKHVVILDVFCISAGFVLRIFAGTTVIHVVTSSWLIACTISLTLFLGFTKRRNEICFVEDDEILFRAVLEDYSKELLDKFILISSAITLVFYSLYTLDEKTIEHFHTDALMYTIPIVIFGLFRYLYLVYEKKEGGDPSLLLLEDKIILLTVVVWIATAVGVIYV
ncbi:MAG: decaprenyl-phosphate phosphoribosyltransferase [Nitrospinae bacterium]|nr:decaprenyl-phosphate phosphoribosyltransferase [Nitrospinota bacterium]